MKTGIWKQRVPKAVSLILFRRLILLLLIGDGGIILLGVEEKNDHTLYIQDGLTDVEKMKNTFRKLVNNRQKISHNIVTNSMVYVAQLGGKDVLVVEVPRAERRLEKFFRRFILSNRCFILVRLNKRNGRGVD